MRFFQAIVVQKIQLGSERKVFRNFLKRKRKERRRMDDHQKVAAVDRMGACIAGIADPGVHYTVSNPEDGF